jgi:Ran GTPase-activating protein (RanGAP) involved in mRNA processing and transport
MLCEAVRACPTLSHLRLIFNPPNAARHRSVAKLIEAATSLPALSELDLRDGAVHDRIDAGRALGALLRANRPSLHILRVRDCYLGDEAMAALLDGLAANTHSRTYASLTANGTT